ncbi:uncharacterized protein LOC125648270 isoform X3 [Ostrea edulis]|uniref:uncharacterized protein LOC125648270 isoform X3 n=1 Tax=Ostrea edulis TaxID=37623 RepID=UPI0020965288|nr:uncharacterized protein LOC125648270 isoform X3 [Ostrea edulis]
MKLKHLIKDLTIMEGFRTSVYSVLLFVVATSSIEIKTQHFREKQEACAFGINSDVCTENYIEKMAAHEDNLQGLKTGNPGKRRQTRSAGSPLNLFVEDLLRKNEALQSIEQILNNVSKTVHQEKKRSCTLNLAYHCQTSEYAGLTDLYNYLNSNASPGKRR